MQALQGSREISFLIITGMSGAGKTQVIRALEDVGYFCVDNFPPALIDKFAELIGESQIQIRRVALVIDIRGGLFFDDLFAALEKLEERGFVYRILFLEASDEALVRRFKETRRRHPLTGEGGILSAVHRERKKLEEIRGKANWIIDTSNLTPRQLRMEVSGIFSEEEALERMVVHIVSFGYKRGVPLDADLLFDVRFLPNPHYVESLQKLDGTAAEVNEYVFKWNVTKTFMSKLYDFVSFLLPLYMNEGKSQLTIGIGCTGGKHRSVALAEHLGALLENSGYKVIVEHRDAAKADSGVDD